MSNPKKPRDPLAFVYTEAFRRDFLQLCDNYRERRNIELRETGQCVICLAVMDDMTSSNESQNEAEKGCARLFESYKETR